MWHLPPFFFYVKTDHKISCYAQVYMYCSLVYILVRTDLFKKYSFQICIKTSFLVCCWSGWKMFGTWKWEISLQMNSLVLITWDIYSQLLFLLLIVDCFQLCSEQHLLFITSITNWYWWCLDWQLCLVFLANEFIHLKIANLCSKNYLKHQTHLQSSKQVLPFIQY